MLRIITRGSAAQPVRVSVVLLTYKRPHFLKECLKSLQLNAGISDYEILVWDNNKKNIGASAMPKLLKKAKGEFFVATSDDVLWYSPNWLRTLVEAFQQKPGIDTEQGWIDEWGALGLNGLKDNVTNSGCWPDLLVNKVEYKIKNTWFWGNVVPHTAALIFRTQLLRDLSAFPEKPKYKHYIHSHALFKIMETHRMVGQLRDVYGYEACGPYWTSPEMWLERQKTQTREEAFKIYKQRDSFDFTDTKPQEAFNKGKFQQYATDLYRRTCKL